MVTVVLVGEAVMGEDFVMGEVRCRLGSFDVIDYVDDVGNVEGVGDGVQRMLGVFYYFCFFVFEQYEGVLCVVYVEWFVVLVQH